MIYGLDKKDFTEEFKNMQRSVYNKNRQKKIIVLEKIKGGYPYPELGKTQEDVSIKYGQLFPLFNTINIETTSWCNFKCFFCPNSFLNRSKNLMNDMLFRKIIDELVDMGYKGEIRLHQSNEPLTDLNICSKVEYIRKNLKSNVGFYSNGSLLSLEKLEKLYDVGLNFLGVEAYISEQQFEIYKKKFEKFSKNKNVILHCQDKNGGYSYANLKTRFKTDDLFITLSRRYVKRNNEIFFDYNSVKVTSRCGIIPSKLKCKENICVRPFRKLQINWNGYVNLCCEEWLYGAIMGDLNKNSIVDIWNGKKFFKYRQLLQYSNRSMYPCNVCNFSGGTWFKNIRKVK